MDPLSRDSLAGNAFRILGLSASAAQPEIDAAARRMRIWSDPAQVPPTPWDLAWLGPLSRSRPDIEQAVARLCDPVSRIRERLFWFQTPPSRTRANVECDRPNARTDAALLRLASALVADPDLASPQRWRSALTDFCQSVASQTYRAWFLAAEEGGEFEKRASRSEVFAAVDALPASIAQSLATRARDALDRDRAAACVELTRLLRSLAPDRVLADRLETGICDRIEDLLAYRCEQARDDLYRNIPWNGGGKIRQVRAKCREIDRQIASSIDPLFHAMSAIESRTDGRLSERMSRVGLPAARMLRNLGLGWGRVGQRGKADRAFRRAWQLTDDRQMIEKLQTDLADLKKKPKQASRSWVGAIVAIIFGLGRLVAMFSDNSPSQPHSTPPMPEVTQLNNDIRRLQNLNYPSVPRMPPTTFPFNAFLTQRLSHRAPSLIPATEPSADERPADKPSLEGQSVP